MAGLTTEIKNKFCKNMYNFKVYTRSILKRLESEKCQEHVEFHTFLKQTLSYDYQRNLTRLVPSLILLCTILNI